MAQAQVAAKQSSIGFGKAERKLLTDPLDSNNPVTVQVLGICSALAVTTGMKNALVMAIAVIFVTMFANMITSALRNAIPKAVRMIVQLIIIATLVTIVELTLKAVAFDSYKQLSVFIGFPRSYPDFDESYSCYILDISSYSGLYIPVPCDMNTYIYIIDDLAIFALEPSIMNRGFAYLAPQVFGVHFTFLELVLRSGQPLL